MRKKIDDATILKLYGDFEQHSEQGRISYRTAKSWSSVVRQFGDEFRFTPSPEEVQLPSRLSSRTWKPWPDTVAALRQLQTRFRLAIFSNVDDDLFAGTRPQLELISMKSSPLSKPRPTNPR